MDTVNVWVQGPAEGMNEIHKTFEWPRELHIGETLAFFGADEKKGEVVQCKIVEIVHFLGSDGFQTDVRTEPVSQECYDLLKSWGWDDN